MVLARYNNEWKTVAGGTCYADTPVGTIQAYGGTQLPAGWLLCNGAELLISAYPELYDVIGDAFGTASDTDHFVLPDLRNKTTFGAGSATGGLANVGDSTVGSLPNITGRFVEGDYYSQIRNYNDSDSGAFKPGSAYGGFYSSYAGGNDQFYMTFDASRSSSMYKNTDQVVPASVGVNYIIKAKKVALPADFNAHVKETIADTFPKYQAGEYIEPFGDIGDSNYISYTSEFTAPSAGYLIGDLGRNYSYSRTTDPKLLVNGISLIAIYSSDVLLTVPLYIPLRKGDKITFNMDSGDRLNRGRLKFFPM